jgi:AcrR family transcriptional regulator
MPRLIETESRTDAVVAAINHLLARYGATSLSIRSIARESGVSGSSLLHHYGTRERIIRLAALRTGRARVHSIDSRILRDGLLAFLPADLDDVVDARAWLAWLELWRSDEALLTAVDGVRRDERSLLAAAVDYRLIREELDAVVALVEGLLVAVCAPLRPLPLPRAQAILTAQIGHALARTAS